MFADLHLHTLFSDGTFTPEELAGHGRRLGFRAMALSDHDTVEGCARMGVACAEAGVEFIPAAELTAEQDGHELHILGYFLDTSDQNLLAELAKFQLVRQDRIREMVARIRKLNVPLSEEQVFEVANCRAPGRPHVARALVKAGLCGSLDEAFDRFLRKGKPAWVPKFKMSAPRAIELIHASGGLAVMAHPGLNNCDELIPELAQCGLDGLECYHTKHPWSTAEHYVRMAEQAELLITGGSDCHGLSKGRPLIGGIKLPYWRVEAMKKAVRKWQNNRPQPAAAPENTRN